MKIGNITTTITCKLKVKISIWNILKIKLLGLPVKDYLEFTKEDKK